MFDPVNADLNRHLARQEALEDAWESCDDMRNRQNEIKEKVAAYMVMDDADFTDAMADDLAALENEYSALCKRIEDVMGYTIEWPHLY